MVSVRKLVGGFALMAMLVLGACTVVVDEGPRPLPPGPGPGPQICTREYAPVCATRGDTRRTFGNACLAESSGYRIRYGGECRGGGPGPGPIGPGPGPGRPQMCPQIYAPVCGSRGGDRETFSNACMAEAAGYRVRHDGACRMGPGPGPGPIGPGPGGPQVCTREYAPVCARRGPAVRTFGNACEARSAGFQIVGGGPC